MRHNYNKHNKKHKQERSQSDDVDESELVDEMPGRTVLDGCVRGRKNYAGSALSHDRGYFARSYDVEEAAGGQGYRAGFSEHRHMLNAGSALVVRGSARGRHKEDRNTEDEAGSALSVNQLRLMIDLTSSHEENIATGDVLVGLCYFPHRVRQMLCSYLDQATTQTSLFV